MRRFVDLHTHSNASDGQLTPTELIEHADRALLAGIALTDHDTLAGLDEAREAARRCPELQFACGLEISALFPRGTLHVLAYGFEPDSPPLVKLTEQFRAARNERNPKILSRLGELGLDVDMDDVLAAAGKVGEGDQRIVSRVHMARALVNKRYVRDTQEAFDRYIGAGAPAYVDKEIVSPTEAIETIHDAGGLAVLAHPVQLKYKNLAQLERMVRDLIDAGLDGIEAYHSDHTDDQTRSYIDLAKKFDLEITGGSDFHGASKPDVRLGKPRVPAGILSNALRERIFNAE